MAKQTLPPFFTGTIDLITFYEMFGRFFARAKSSLTGERVKTDPCFISTMYQAGIMARASKIGSILYALVPKEYRQHSLYRTLTGQANLLLKKGMEENEIVARVVASHIAPLKKKRVKAMLKARKAKRRKSNKAGLPAYLRRNRRLKMYDELPGTVSNTPTTALAAIVGQMVLEGRSYPSWLLPDLPGIKRFSS